MSVGIWYWFRVEENKWESSKQYMMKRGKKEEYWKELHFLEDIVLAVGGKWDSNKARDEKYRKELDFLKDISWYLVVI